MIVQFTKAEPAARADTICCIREGGSTCTQPMPRQGVLPRAAIHFVLEQTLGWPDGLFGEIARGACLADLAVPESVRAGDTSPPVLQSHAVVECLQADQWGGASDPATFTLSLANACRRLGVPTPELTAAPIERVRAELRAFGAEWRPLAVGTSLQRIFEPGPP